MSLWRHVTHGFRVLMAREASDQDIADEVAHYFEQATAELLAAGHSPEDARRIARLELGNASVIREQVRSYGWESYVDAAVNDVRFAARQLRNAPGFALIGVCTIALGVGVTTAIFSAVNPILFDPLPYPAPDRITMISDRATDGSPLDVTFGTFREVAQRSRSFDALAVTRQWQPAITGAAEPQRLDGQRVSADYFRVLGVMPVIGRSFNATDDLLNGPRVVVLSDALWRRRFNADPRIIGQPVKLNDDDYIVLGVMPRGFENVIAPAADVWAPLQYDASLPPQGREWGHHLRMIGRLKPNVDVAAARWELNAIAGAPLRDFPRVAWASLGQGLAVGSLQEDLTRAVRPALLAMFGAVLLVLVISCLNVINLLLARGAQRKGEFALRGALGAERQRLIRQLLTETLLLAFIGGALGLAVAQIAVKALVASSPEDLPRLDAVHLDSAVFFFAFAVTTLVGLVVGLIPALGASRADVNSALQHSSRRTAGVHGRMRGTLVVAEVALAIVLLVTAGLLLRSVQRLFAVNPGFNQSNMLVMNVQAAGHRFDSEGAALRFFESVTEAVRAVPGVTAAAFTSQLPLSGDSEWYGIRLEGAQTNNADGEVVALRYAVTPGYFQTMGIPLLKGRLPDARDVAHVPASVVISESFAKRAFPGRDAIGTRMHVGDTIPWFTVVGVVGNVKHSALSAGDGEDGVYMAEAQWHWPDRAMWLVVRTRQDTPALAAAIRSAVWSVDKDQPITRVGSMQDIVAASAADRRFALRVFEAFAAVALLLCAIGIFGVVSGGVTERLREIGVRSAIGASSAQILALVLGRGMRLTAVGVAIGLTGAIAASSAVESLLYGTSKLDPVTYLAVTVLLAAVSALACTVPARRALSVDPCVTLRAE